ncbi:MAG: V-type ATP synthase subunit E [Treponema sp.]|jgi:V/A-type H+-transporting ATPase subunit E|nr:V-type ATP synthase subunit E [Treponema sp.]
MDIQVQELINKIKKDGVDAAAEEAAKIKAEAEAESKRILESAKKEADGIISRGKQDAERSEKAGIAALEQASRNLVLVFKEEIQSLLDKLISEQVSADYGNDVLKAALPDLLKAWVAKGENNLAVLLPENKLSAIQGFFYEQLTGELWKGVELKSSRKLSSGFRITNKEGSVYYDFSAESVAELLSAYLNPKLAEILKSAAKNS